MAHPRRSACNPSLHGESPMTFEEVVDQASAMLQRRGRVTYRLLKRQFNLDDEALEDLKLALGAALLMTKGQGAPEVEHAYTQARALCQQVGETPELVSVLFGLWRLYVMRPQLHTARELDETLLCLAQRADDPVLAVIAHYALGLVWFYLATLPVAR